ncbi:MAG: hypothetical protein ABI432_01325 [Flavobacteriales bacterium]
MKHLPFVALLTLALGTSASAQTTVDVGSFAFSDGVHPTFSFIFEGTDTKYVEGYWRDELKKVSMGVSHKKEVIASGVVVPRVSTDTVRVLVKAEQRKGSPLITAHVAILTKSGWLAPGGDERAYEGGRSFVQQHSTALRRQLAQQELTNAEKGLARLQDDLAGLQREKERAESSIEKSKQKAAEAVQEQERSKAELDALAPRIDAQRNLVASTPSEENTKALNDLLKQQSRATDKNRRALDDERNMKKKADDLAWDISKNVEDQARKTEAITRQETLVNSLREKLAAIQ